MNLEIALEETPFLGTLRASIASMAISLVGGWAGGGVFLAFFRGAEALEARGALGGAVFLTGMVGWFVGLLVCWFVCPGGGCH